MLALGGLAWFAIGEGVVILLLLAAIVILLLVLGRYEPHFEIAPYPWPTRFGEDPGKKPNGKVQK